MCKEGKHVRCVFLLWMCKFSITCWLWTSAVPNYVSFLLTSFTHQTSSDMLKHAMKQCGASERFLPFGRLQKDVLDKASKVLKEILWVNMCMYVNYICTKNLHFAIMQAFMKLFGKVFVSKRQMRFFGWLVFQKGLQSHPLHLPPPPPSDSPTKKISIWEW